MIDIEIDELTEGDGYLARVFQCNYADRFIFVEALAGGMLGSFPRIASVFVEGKDAVEDENGVSWLHAVVTVNFAVA
jgi:hypothetical protein